MGHCIGSYGRCCSRGTSAIFSISDHQQRRRSTLELKIEATGDEVVESFHCGFKNSKPGVFELAAAKELIEYLNSSTLADAVREHGEFQRQAIHHREVIDLRNQRQKEYVLMTQRVAWDCYLDAGNIARA